MKTLREFAEMILNQVSENMGYRGEIVEIPNNNVENRVGLALSEPGNKLSPIVMISDLYEEYKTFEKYDHLKLKQHLFKYSGLYDYKNGIFITNKDENNESN